MVPIFSAAVLLSSSGLSGTVWGILELAYFRDLNRLEILTLLLILPLTFLASWKHPDWPKHLRISWSPPGGLRAVVLIGLLAIVARSALLIVDPVPEPHVTDEFSFLLQADTFLHGRLANPTPPFWQQFESIHILMTPTYASMYFPMQGLILAFGRWLGVAWLGVLLSSGVMCGAIVWMLQGWMPSRWAFLGGLLALARFALFSYWIDGYYGGIHAAIGGALVLGAWPRLARKAAGQRRLTHAIAMAAGLAILAAGRPYEGLLLCIPVAVAMFFAWGRPARDIRVFVPVAAGVLLVALALGYYCWRVTGSPWTTPYEVNRQQYGWPQTLLLVKAPQPPPFRHAEMARYFQWESSFHAQASTDAALFLFLLKNLIVWSFFVGPVLSLSLLAAPRIWRDRRVRLLLAPAIALLAGLGLSQTVVPHYAAPATAAILALVVQGIRHLRFARVRGFAVGAPLLAAMALTTVFILTARVVKLGAGSGDNSSWCCAPPARHPGRADVLRDLLKQTGNHIVLVRYAPNHFFHDEWVYNDADIPGSRVIWSRLLSREENRAMVNYYSDRRVWLLEPDTQPPSIRELQR
jgi:hypothetical protein